MLLGCFLHDSQNLFGLNQRKSQNVLMRCYIHWRMAMAVILVAVASMLRQAQQPVVRRTGGFGRLSHRQNRSLWLGRLSHRLLNQPVTELAEVSKCRKAGIFFEWGRGLTNRFNERNNEKDSCCVCRGRIDGKRGVCPESL